MHASKSSSKHRTAEGKYSATTTSRSIRAIRELRAPKGSSIVVDGENVVPAFPLLGLALRIDLTRGPNEACMGPIEGGLVREGAEVRTIGS